MDGHTLDLHTNFITFVTKLGQMLVIRFDGCFVSLVLTSVWVMCAVQYFTDMDFLPSCIDVKLQY
jgi:hypothetical protein